MSAKPTVQELPGFIAPCLATPRRLPPSGTQWLHEVKLDGYRLLAYCANGTVRLLTRAGHDWTSRFGGIAAELARWKMQSAILDGEAIIRSPDGTTDFGALVSALNQHAPDAIEYLVFDLLYLDGIDLRAKRLDERKAALSTLIANQKQARRVHGLDSVEGEGEALLEAACAIGLEGIISKRRDRPYRSGRQPTWVKSKCLTSEDFVIVGFLASNADPRSVGALVVAERKGRKLSYAGRVGTGFTVKGARELYDALSALKAHRTVAVPRGTPTARIVWTQPVLEARVHFRERTSDGILRHAVFKGLREA